jgi:hypothetical protein
MYHNPLGHVLIYHRALLEGREVSLSTWTMLPWFSNQNSYIFSGRVHPTGSIPSGSKMDICSVMCSSYAYLKSFLLSHPV